MSLTDLPPEVLQALTTDLDRSSSLNLALVCKYLQSIAEQSIWREIDFSLHPTQNHIPQQYSFGSNRLLRLRHMLIWQQDLNEVGRVSLQAYLYSNFMHDFLDHLARYPQWVKSVRRISVDIDQSLCTPFQDLIQMVSPTLKSLEIHPPEYPFSPAYLQSSIRSSHIFMGLNTQLTNLKHLHLTLEGQWQDILHSALLCAPYITDLRLSPFSAHAGGWGKEIILEHPDGRLWPPVNYLKRLEVDEMFDQLAEMITSLLQTSQNSITHLSLRDPRDSWKPSPQQPLLKMMANLKKLQYLALSKNVLDILARSKYMPPVKTLSITDANITQDSMHEIIPQCETMTTLYLHGLATPPVNQPSLIVGQHSQSLSDVRSIASTLLQEIGIARNLQLILFPHGTTEGADIFDECISHEELLRKVGRGIRIYTSTTVDQHESREIFTHMKSYTAHPESGSNSQTQHTKGIWEDHAAFNGSCVPADTLEEVYRIAGIERNVYCQGRDLDLPTRAWEVLRAMKG